MMVNTFSAGSLQSFPGSYSYLKSSIRLGQNFPFNVVGTKDGLFQLNISQSHKGKRKTFKQIFPFLVVENHSVRGQIQSSSFIPTCFQSSYGSSPGKVHCDIVTEQKDAVKGKGTSKLHIWGPS